LGVDFTAILDHQLSSEELGRLLGALNTRWTTPSSLAGFLAGHPNAGKNWRWRLSPTFSSAAEELFDEGHVHLEGPACFAAEVFKRALEVTSCARWWSFLFEEDVRAGLLDGVRSLAVILRSSTIVYLPDSAYPSSAAADRLYDGGGVAEVLSWLQTNIGQAASSIDALRGADADHWDESAYVIERVAARV
jgi:hypothetical protein